MTRGQASTNDIGEFRLPRLEPGRYLLYVQPIAQGDEDGPRLQPAYYPGVASVENAQPIVVEAGTLMAEISITLVEGDVTPVRGRIVATDGKPLAASAYVSVREFVPAMRENWSNLGTSTDPSGSFRLSLAPGDYYLEARAMGLESQRPQTVEQFGMTRVTVGADAVDDVVITMGSGAYVSAGS